jgi:hypothetical protein
MLSSEFSELFLFYSSIWIRIRTFFRIRIRPKPSDSFGFGSKRLAGSDCKQLRSQSSTIQRNNKYGTGTPDSSFQLESILREFTAIAKDLLLLGNKRYIRPSCMDGSMPRLK